jgi:hypothetical protein
VDRKGTVRIVGIATKSAREGDLAEVEVDLGTTSDFLTALPNEPPDVTLIRSEREQELVAQLNAANLSLQREQRRSTLLEQQLSTVTSENSQFIENLAEIIAGKLMFKFGDLFRGDY